MQSVFATKKGKNEHFYKKLKIINPHSLCVCKARRRFKKVLSCFAFCRLNCASYVHKNPISCAPKSGTKKFKKIFKKNEKKC